MPFKPLQDGQLIRVVQPAYRINQGVVGALRYTLESAGLPVDELRPTRGYGKLSANDDERASEFFSALADPRVGAILIGHGGYGCMRILEHLDWNTVSKYPKPVIGFSDATALLVPLASAIGPNSIHGPNAASLVRRADPTTIKALVSILRGDWDTYNGLLYSQSARLKILRHGYGTGRMVGGNLSVLAALCGTPYGVDAKNAILFLEDWNEPQYRFDRMLTQLKLAGVLDHIAGLVLGEFVDIGRIGEDIAEEIEERIIALVPREIPIISGFPAGHGPRNFPLLMGGRYELRDTVVALTP